MPLYLLDKNVVEDIKQSLNGVPTKGAAVARAIDLKGNIASPLLSILEGSVQRAQSGPELYDQLMADTLAVSRFYRLAKTDSGYLRTFGAMTATAFAPHMREKTETLAQLAMKLQALVVQQRKLHGARDLLPKIDALANDYEVNLSHPLVTCAVACLYGSGPARGVLKPAVRPTHQGAYNAVADIRLIMETAYIRKRWNENRIRQGVQLLSSDKNLCALSNLLQLRVELSLLTGEVGPEIVAFTATMSHKLLPNLQMQPKEMERVLNYLRTSRNTNKSILA